MDRATRPEGNIADIQHGWDVYGSDEEKVGSVSEVQSSYLVAHKGFFFPKDLYIPHSAIARIEHDRVYLNVVKDDVDSQGWDAYPGNAGAASGSSAMGAGAVRSGIPDAIGTPGLSGSTDEGGRNVRAAGGGAGERSVNAMPATSTGGDTLHLHEEQLQVHKERSQAGEVRVGKEVVEEQKTINVPVTREEVYIERVPGDGKPDQHTMDDSASETVNVPVSEERVTVEKTPVLIEEVRVGKREVQENRQVTDTVQRERARIENEGNVRLENADDKMADRGKL